MQLVFHEVEGKSIQMLEVAVSSCTHSRFNTRKTRDAEAVKKLAERMLRNGFERTRALWATDNGGIYEVFAGGTRLEAARLAELATVPVMLHAGYSDEEISRRADEDNENDEYHLPVSPVDVWAEYARLKEEEGWIQERIAQAKRTSQSIVSDRLRLFQLCVAYPAVAKFITERKIKEANLRQILRLSLSDNLGGWLLQEQAWFELAQLSAHGASKNGEKSENATGADVDTWKEFIAYADGVYKRLDERVTLFDLSEQEPKPTECRPKEAFVKALAKDKARSLVRVKAAENEVLQHINRNLQAYNHYLQTKSTEAAKAAQKAQEEQTLLGRFICGDALEELPKASVSNIRLLLTDPPYGMDYQSNRRWKSKAPEKIANDGSEEAMTLLKDMLEATVPRLAQDAHVLVFCNWQNEPQVRAIMEVAGLKVKGSLIWVKEEHSAGDVRGAFAPRHERIVHAVTGNPEINPRIPDVLQEPRDKASKHPTPKPIELLRMLIKSTTTDGDLVVDPFAGCAPTLIAARQLKREFWGCELDKDYHDEGSRKLLNAL